MYLNKYLQNQNILQALEDCDLPDCGSPAPALLQCSWACLPAESSPSLGYTGQQMPPSRDVTETVCVHTADLN